MEKIEDLNELVSLFREREEAYQELTKGIFEKIKPTVLEGSKEYFNSTIKWYDVVLYPETGMLAAIGIMPAEDENEEDKIVRVSVPLEIIAKNSKDDIVNFFEETEKKEILLKESEKELDNSLTPEQKQKLKLYEKMMDSEEKIH